MASAANNAGEGAKQSVVGVQTEDKGLPPLQVLINEAPSTTSGTSIRHPVHTGPRAPISKPTLKLRSTCVGLVPSSI